MNNQTSQQFNALQKATATYQNDAKMADHMRRREVDLMNRSIDGLIDRNWDAVFGLLREM